MYDNIGKKIKSMAKVIFWIETISAGIALIGLSPISLGVLIGIGGFGIAVMTTWLIYGFGELIDKVSDIARNTYKNDGKSEAQLKDEYGRKEKIEALRSQGLITEEEYQEIIRKENI